MPQLEHFYSLFNILRRFFVHFYNELSGSNQYKCYLLVFNWNMFSSGKPLKYFLKQLIADLHRREDVRSVKVTSSK